jgi:SAM-dependent methyltransferase
MTTPWHVKLYRGYRAVVRSDRFLTRRFIAGAAKASDSRKVDICVDVGAGYAPYRQAVLTHFSAKSYFALDFKPSDATDLVADGTALPMLTQSIDLIVCFESLQHIPRYHLMLDEAARALRSDGYVILSVPFMYCECDVVDFRRWTTAGIVQELEERGFTVLRAAHRGGALFAIVNIMIWAIQHGIPGSRVTWRSSRTAGAYCREAIVNLLTLPLTLLCWPAFIIDNLLPARGFYAGTFIFAQLRQTAEAR